MIIKCTVLYLTIAAALAFVFTGSQAKANTAQESSISIIQRPETVRISAQGKIYVGEREVNLRQLGRRLRRDGYAQTDTIYVSIPEETPQRVLVAVGRELASQGYRRVIFTRPPRAVAEAKEE